MIYRVEKAVPVEPMKIQVLFQIPHKNIFTQA